ncbi:hypothetical protein [Plasticicumulans acidivorans]|uniref:Uncharacterized protein n=1 Tax=Plasticicumulans acidivorans TaxID=886464 RepID=A0A317N0I1_9GAMM|nr:hypothetical protein [Plasticicumulans acidivorans]PWV66005.1 hypothetical protein C7443_101493 [Plasticicumulans acidivorans]
MADILVTVYGGGVKRLKDKGDGTVAEVVEASVTLGDITAGGLTDPESAALLAGATAANQATQIAAASTLLTLLPTALGGQLAPAALAVVQVDLDPLVVIAQMGLRTV